MTNDGSSSQLGATRVAFYKYLDDLLVLLPPLKIVDLSAVLCRLTGKGRVASLSDIDSMVVIGCETKEDNV